MNKLILLIGLLLFDHTNILAQSTNDKWVVRISGKIINAGANSVKCRLIKDYILLKEEEFVVPVAKDSSFSFAFEIEKPTVIQFLYENRADDIYIEPNDSLYILFDAARSKITPLNFYGRGSVHNNYLTRQKNRLRQQSPESILNEMLHDTPTKFLAFMEKGYQARLKFYETYEEKKLFSSNFQKYIVNDTHYWKALCLIRYRWEHLGDKTGMVTDLPLDDPYYDFLKEKELLNNEEALQNLNYVYFLEQYLTYISEKESINRQEAIKTYFKGKTYYFSEATRLFWHSRNTDISLSQLKTVLEEFYKTNPYKEYNSTLQEAFLERQANDELNHSTHKIYSIKLLDAQGKTVSLENYKGKVIYIDFWATWCQPCIQEMNASQKLKQELNKMGLNNEVIFLYISIDKNEYDWKNFISRNQLLQNQFHLPTGKDSDIAKVLKASIVPYFVIIDKEGYIVSSPAPRPSSDDAFRQIFAAATQVRRN